MVNFFRDLLSEFYNGSTSIQETDKLSYALLIAEIMEDKLGTDRYK